MSQIDANLPEAAEQPKTYEGILGWTLIPLIQLILAPVGMIYFLVLRMRHPMPLPNWAEISGAPLFYSLVGLVTLLVVVSFLWGLYCLVQFLQKKRQVKRLMITWYAIGIATAVLMGFQMSIDPDRFLKMAIELRGPKVTMMAEEIRIVVQLVILGLLILYFDVSKRVKNTFVR
jgi:hypothetical protein